MKNEAEFNTIVTHSLTFGHKIGDQGSTITGFHGKNPFDGFGIASTDLGNYPVYFESKFLKEPSAFNWSRIWIRSLRSRSLLALYRIRHRGMIATTTLKLGSEIACSATA